MFRDIRLGMKILAGFIVLTVITITVGIVGTYNIKKIDNADTKLFEKMTVPLGDLGQAGMDFHRIRVNLRDAITSENQNEKERLLKRVDELDSEMEKNIDEYSKTILTDEGRQQYTDLKKAIDEYRACQKKMTDFIHEDKDAEANKILYGDGGSSARKVIELLDKMYALKITIAKKTSDENTALANSASSMMLILIILASIFAAVLTFILTRNVRNIITTLLSETKRLVDAAINGKLDTRADPEKVNFEFRDIVVGVNNTLDSVIGPLNVAAEYVERISRGDIPQKITDSYHGDFNEIKNNLNMCIDAVSLLVSDANMLAQAAVDGKLDTRADASKHQGDFTRIVKGVNDTLDAVIGPLNVAAEYVDRISHGDIPPKITDTYNGDFNEIKNNLNQCIDNLNGVVEAMVKLNEEQKAGDIEYFIPEEKFDGSYRRMVNGTNEVLKLHITTILRILGVLSAYAEGDLSKQLERLPGKQVIANDNLDTLRNNLTKLLNELQCLVDAAKKGELSQRGKVDQFKGAFADVVSGVNTMLDAVIGPLNVAAEYVERISRGDVPNKITHKYNLYLN